MELEQYNIKAFQDGLEDILKNPWKKPVYIQDTIPTFPEESNDKDRTIHDLIKVMFVYKRLVSPYYSTVGHLCLNKSYFLKYVLETYSKKEEFSILFKGTSRLTSHQIYEAFYGMSPNNASFLLDRIDCPISVYTKLKDALESREELKFAEAIDECDISNILPALKFVLFVKNQIKQLDGLGSQNNEAVDSDFETEKLKMRYKAENEMTEKFDVSPSSKFNQENKTFIDELLRLMNNPNELLESFYPPLFCQYCQMKKGGGLNDSDVKAFEYIFHQPAFEEQYERCMKLWETGELEDMFSKRSEKNNLGEEVVDSVAANKKEQQTPQIKEPNKEEVKNVSRRSRNIPGQGRGRPKDCWIKGRSQIEEEQIGALIQSAIWKSLVESVKKLKYKKGIKGKTKEKQVKNLSAGLLYFALENIGWARVYDEYGIQSSFVWTMKFADIARTSFVKNIRYIHEWYNLADDYKEYPNQFDECYSTSKEKDPNMAFLIFENVNEIGKIIDDLNVKLKKTLDENCKL